MGIEKSLDMASKGARETVSTQVIARKNFLECSPLQLFKARLKTVTSVYSLLGEALSQYETAVKAVAMGG